MKRRTFLQACAALVIGAGMDLSLRLGLPVGTTEVVFADWELALWTDQETELNEHVWVQPESLSDLKAADWQWVNHDEWLQVGA